MKRVALINDLSGIGRCSLTVAIPIISAFGYECAVLPTAVLSNHTGFDSFTFTDYTPKMHEHMDCWEKLGTKFDTVYSGFLGSEEQIDITLEFMSRFGKDAIKLVDPVLGDHGKAYSTCTKGICEHMKRLVHRADIITPNLTELCILTSKAYPENGTSLENIQKMCEEISKNGPHDIVVTGLENSIVHDIDPDMIANFVFEDGKVTVTQNKKVSVPYCGTGDVFASVLCGAIISGRSFKSAVKQAAEFTELCTRSTFERGGDRLYGVQFEDKLKLL